MSSYSEPLRYVYEAPSARWNPRGWQYVSANNYAEGVLLTFWVLVHSVFLVRLENILRVVT